VDTAAALLLNLLSDLTSGLRVHVRHDNRCPLYGKAPGRRRPDTASSTGDYRNLVNKTRYKCILPSV
jgi:hypothetical protein